ncbi:MULTISPECIES: histidine phosphatase family protein [Paenibacillus]|uniref:histidine phosphatase family protein n=1 Tax=Paenibacillus TaxID=44249 RepID=UPI0009FCC94C|nr:MULTISPECIES: histidine phosphatase family protein [Paenibacillus]MEC0259808.1 histidine phosphatase family protein [Paenibacillus lautus]
MFNKLFSALVISAIVLLLEINIVEARESLNGRDSTLFEEIQKGGYILFLRHGEATIGQDQPGLTFHDCATQRNLSQTGRDQARMIGTIFKEKMIPIQYPVISSPYCRAQQTAEIAFGTQNVSVNPFLASIVQLSAEGVPEEEKQRILVNLSEMLEIPPARGSNTVIVGHAFPRGLALGEIPSMGTIVIKPKGIGKGYEIVSKLTLQEFIEWSHPSLFSSKPYKSWDS